MSGLSVAGNGPPFCAKVARVAGFGAVFSCRPRYPRSMPAAILQAQQDSWDDVVLVCAVTDSRPRGTTHRPVEGEKDRERMGAALRRPKTMTREEAKELSAIVQLLARQKGREEALRRYRANMTAARE